MTKLSVITLAVSLSLAGTAFAGEHATPASNGKGDGKGRSGVAESVSAGGGTANAASGLNGGWGSVGGVSKGKEATAKD